MEEIIYQKSFMEYREELTNELTRAAEGFVRIGYLLKVARDTDILEGKGYDGYIDFAQKEYGLDKSQVSRFIRINDRFSEGGNSETLMQQYKAFGYSKLTLMLSLPEALNEELDPSMTKAEIQAVKEEVDEEKKVTDIERMLEEPAPEGTILYKTLWQLLHDNTDLFMEIYMEWTQTPDSTVEILAPEGMKMYTVRVSGIGRIFFKVSEEECSLTNPRNGEKKKVTVSEIIKELGDLIFDGTDEARTPEDTWSLIYKEDFPENEEVAPVQPSKVQKAPKGKTPEQKENERQAKIDRETKKKLEEKEDEEFMNAPIPERESVHEEKTAPSFFEAAMAGKKLFELRKNDRNYHVGDTLVQKEFKENEYTGRELIQEITFVQEDYAGLEEGYCILGTENKDLKTEAEDGGD